MNACLAGCRPFRTAACASCLPSVCPRACTCAWRRHRSIWR
jgi:hypothetical protein